MVWFALNEDQKNAILELQKVESDRITAILGAAMLDDSLTQMLKFRLRPKTDSVEQLFKVNGALGNLGPKIHLAYSLYMFEKPLRRALIAMGEIRNKFAHKLTLTMASADFNKQFEDPTLHAGLKVYPSPVRGAPEIWEIESDVSTNKRTQFIVNLKLALGYIYADESVHAPHSNEPLV
jgi:hypothetical protein